jgi:hypothetical protein
MQSLKDKLYNYEVEPPVDSWHVIVKALNQDQSTASKTSKRSKVFYFTLNVAAATVVLIFCSLILYLTGPGKANNADSSFGNSQNLSNTTDDEKTSNKYITISGPQGQPVKISAKAAKLIVSSDNQNPPKPVWSAQVNKWKDLMSTNVLAPTSTNFLDIVELTQALK